MRVCFLNNLTASEGNLTATCNAVYPYKFFLFGLAPYCINIFDISVARFY